MHPMNVSQGRPQRIHPYQPVGTMYQENQDVAVRNPYGGIQVNNQSMAAAAVVPQLAPATTGAEVVPDIALYSSGQPNSGMPMVQPGGGAKPAAQEESGSGEGEEVEINGAGTLYRMMIYCIATDDPDFAQMNGAKVTRAMKAMKLCMTRSSFYPLVIQTIFLIVVARACWPNEWPDQSSHDLETRVVVILALVVYFWSITELFFGHTLRQLWMLTEARISTCSYIQCWIMFMWELILTFALLLFGTWFLCLSETAVDAILNALALNYIVEIDDMVANHTTAVGGLNACKVPANTVMPESNTEWTSCYKIYACLSVNFINQPILPLLWGLLWCHVVDGEVLDADGNSVALILVIAALAVVVLTSGLSCSLVNLCCCCCADHDGFESSTEETGAYNFGSSSNNSPNPLNQPNATR